MKTWHEVGSVQEVERKGRVIARVGGREIGVIHDPRSRALHAIRNRCPHSGAPLCLGTVAQRVGGRPGRYETTGRAVLRCPWHGWEYDLETGYGADDDRMRVAVYPVRVEGDRVLVQV